MTSSRPVSKTHAATTGTYTGSGGVQLFRQAWRPATPARGVLVNIHGLGDHSGLYPYLVQHLVEAGWAVHAPDLRGNGRSPGRRAYINSWDEFRDDLDRFLQVVRREEPGLPIFLLGNSLGGLIVLDYALDHADQLAGVIAVSSPLGTLSVPKPLMMLAHLMSRIWPTLSKRTGMDLSALARDPIILTTILADPLFHRVGTARLATEVERILARVQREAPNFRVPLLVMHGGADRFVPPDGSRRFVPNVGSRDKEYREYPDGYHVLFADTEREEVLRDLERWLTAHNR